MPSKPYLTDTNGQRLYEGDRVHAYQGSGEILNGTLKLTEDEYKTLYKWSITYDDGTEYYITKFISVYNGEYVEWHQWDYGEYEPEQIP